MMRGGSSSSSIWPASSHSAYGCSAARASLISSSSTIRPWAVSTRNIRPGCRRPLRTTLLGRDLEDADLAGQHDQPVVGDPVPGRSQPVAVEHGPDDRPVGEGHCGRTVPRLHQRGVVAVEGPSGRIHGPVVLPRLGDHHQHRVVQGPTTEVQELQDLVEGGRVAGSRGHDGEGPLQPGDEIGRAQCLPGPHPVPVSGQGVDLTVVGQVPVGMGQRPRGEGVGREAGVHEGEAARHPFVGQVGEELGQLVGGEHPLVGDGAGREGDEVAVLDLVLGPLAQHEGQPVDGQGWIGAGQRGAGRTGPRRAGAWRAWPPRRSTPATRRRPGRCAIRRRRAPPRRRACRWPGGRRRPRPGRATRRRCRWRSGRGRAARSRRRRRRSRGEPGGGSRRRPRCPPRCRWPRGGPGARERRRPDGPGCASAVRAGRRPGPPRRRRARSGGRTVRCPEASVDHPAGGAGPAPGSRWKWWRRRPGFGEESSSGRSNEGSGSTHPGRRWPMRGPSIVHAPGAVSA